MVTTEISLDDDGRVTLVIGNGWDNAWVKVVTLAIGNDWDKPG